MSSPEDALRRLIDGDLDPRRDRHAETVDGADPDPLPVAKADLLYLWDEYGGQYLDMAALNSPLGHGFQPIRDLVAEHMRYHGWTAPPGRHLQRWPATHAAQLSAAFTGPGEEPRRVLFCEGERDAVRQAVPLASGRRCAVLDTGWHDWLMADTVRHDLFGPGDLDIVDWSGFDALLLAAVDTAFAPVPNLRDWTAAARAAGAAVVFDESVTGFGRTGAWWAQEHAGVVADATVLGGPVGGGLPLGAVVHRRGLPGEGAVDPSPMGGHPWACAAGSLLMDTVNPAMLTHAADCGRDLAAALGELCEQFPERLSGHHGVGLLRGLRFRDPALAARFPLEARRHGLHLAPATGATVTLAPVLVSSFNEMKRGVDLMADTLLSCDDAPVPGRTGREGP